jgi:sporulation protein YlmC with PRC-barrel domain
VGEIRDIVMSPNGGAEAVVIGVGGFLGMGEKEVAVDFELISRSMDANGDVWLVVAADREQLEAAPEFDREVVRGQEDGEATADPQAADGDVAVAPATDDTQENVMDTDPDAERTLVPIDSATLSADQITGLDVWGADEESIGSVSDVLVDPEGGVDAFVVDVGGFLGLGAKPVAIGAENLQAVVEGEEWEAIQTSFTQEQLEAHVEYSEQAYQDGDEAVVLRATAN